MVTCTPKSFCTTAEEDFFLIILQFSLSKEQYMEYLHWLGYQKHLACPREALLLL